MIECGGGGGVLRPIVTSRFGIVTCRLGYADDRFLARGVAWHVDRLSIYGVCPGKNESAGQRKSGHLRNGNAWVRRLLCEFAQAAARSRCALKDKFQALKVSKEYKRSIAALGHKMLRTIYAMPSKHTPNTPTSGQNRGL